MKILDQKCDNLVDLESFDEGMILHHVRKRFNEDNVYTNVGNILVAINPFKTINSLYDQNRLERIYEQSIIIIIFNNNNIYFYNIKSLFICFCYFNNCNNNCIKISNYYCIIYCIIIIINSNYCIIIIIIINTITIIFIIILQVKIKVWKYLHMFLQ